MDPERYPHAVAAYLQAEGWKTSGTRVQDSVVAIVGERADGTRRLVALVVADPDTTVERRHLKYLLEAAQQKDADDVVLTAQGPTTERARTIAEEYDVVRLDSETVVGAVTERRQSSQENSPQNATPTQSGGEPSTPRDADQSSEQGHRKRQSQLQALALPDRWGPALRSALGNVPLWGGLIRGVGVSVAGLVFAALLHALVTGASVGALFVPPLGAGTQLLGETLGSASSRAGSPLPTAVVEGAWLLYSAQGVEIVGSALPVEGDLIAAAVDGNINRAVANEYAAGLSDGDPGVVSELGQLFVGFRLLYLIVPFLLFTEAYRLVGTAYDGSDTLVDQAVGGASLLVGYLPVTVAGTAVFTRVAAPALGGAVIAGVLQPLIYGTTGGVAAAVLRGSDASLRQGGYYGLGAAFLASAGTFGLTVLAGGGLGGGELVVATLVVLTHAAALSVPAASGLLPGVLYYVAVVGALAVVSRRLVRSYRGTGRSVDAAIKGSTIAVGFGAGLFATLFVVLVLLVSFDAGIFGTAMGPLRLTAEQAIPMHPVRTVFVGGVIVPALVGGGVGAHLAADSE